MGSMELREPAGWYQFVYPLMMAQRGISVGALARHLGLSKSYTRNILRTLGEVGVPDQVDRIDEAITEITKARGGVYATSKATEGGLAEWQRQMEEDALAMTHLDPKGLARVEDK